MNTKPKDFAVIAYQDSLNSGKKHKRGDPLHGWFEDKRVKLILLKNCGW
jgi:hypothetical protein